jgi:hypothetical protein
MSKWADYVITAVRFNAGDVHIDRIKVQEDLGDKLGPAQEMSRAQVVKLIEQGKSFITAPKSTTNPSQVSKGAIVSVQPVTTNFIKSKADNRISDNLDELPKF